MRMPGQGLPFDTNQLFVALTSEGEDQDHRAILVSGRQNIKIYGSQQFNEQFTKA
jgi:hypothetical protein